MAMEPQHNPQLRYQQRIQKKIYGWWALNTVAVAEVLGGGVEGQSLRAFKIFVLL